MQTMRKTQKTQTTQKLNTATSVRVQVFPVQPDRWIAVVAAPGGTFVTQSQSAAGVASQVRSATEQTMGWVPDMDLVDDRDLPWTPGQAGTQLARLGLDAQRAGAGRDSWLSRLLSRR